MTFRLSERRAGVQQCWRVRNESRFLSRPGATRSRAFHGSGEWKHHRQVVDQRIDSIAPTQCRRSPTPSRRPGRLVQRAGCAERAAGAIRARRVRLACSGGTYSGPDSGSATGTITCTDNAGNSNSAASSPFKYDDTGPQINGSSLGRAPDANGWYNHPVAVNFTATDNLSGVAGCSAVTYSGPDGGSASVPGSCTDVAGNPASGGATIKYDSTGPSVGGSPDRGPDSNGWYNRPVGVSFGGADNASGTREPAPAAGRTRGRTAWARCRARAATSPGTPAQGLCRSRTTRRRRPSRNSSRRDRPMRRAGSTTR